MSILQNQIDTILEQVDRLPQGKTQIALLEEAIRLADSHQRIDLGFSLRKRLMKASTFGGSPEKTLVAFTWCIGQCDKDPELFDVTSLLWEYKWVVGSLVNFPQISRKQIDDSLADMARRFEATGMGLRPIHKLRCDHAVARGDRALAQEAQRLWRSAPIGAVNDCKACEINAQMDYLFFMGKDDRALDIVAPILQGRMRCAEIPHCTLGETLIPLMRKGEIERAAEYHEWGYRLIKKDAEFIGEYQNHLTFLGLTGNFERGLEILEFYLPLVLETNALKRRLKFFRGVLVFLTMMKDSGVQSITLRTPPNFPLHNDSGTVPIQEWIDWVQQDCDRIALAFDKRDEGDFQMKLNRELLDVKSLKRRYPLRG